MNAFSPISADPGIVPSLKRSLKSLPVSTQLAIIEWVVLQADFADLLQADLDTLDTVLVSLKAQAVEADAAEDLALHGRDVAA